MLATTRPERGVVTRLACPVEVLAADSPGNRDDLCDFIEARLRQPALAVALAAAHSTKAAVTVRLSDLARGNFLYAAQALDEIERGAYGFDALDTMPRGLDEKYGWFLRRQFPSEQDFAPHRALLAVLIAAEEPLTVSDLAVVLEREPDEVRRALVRLASFIRIEPGPEPGHALYHKSMTEWLTDPARRDDVHAVDPAAGHAVIAERFWRLFEDEGADALPRYAVLHLPAHLAMCAEAATPDAARGTWLERLIKFVLHPKVQAQVWQRPSAIDAGLRLALARAARSGSGRCVVLVVEAALGRLRFQRGRLNPQRLFDLAAAGDLGAFTRELDVYPADPLWRDLANLLAAWLARDSGGVAEARAFRTALTPSPHTDADLITRVDAVLAGKLAGLPPPPISVDQHLVRAILRQAGGADLEGGSGYAAAEPIATPSPDELENLGDAAPVFLSQIHGPQLVAYSINHREEGRSAFADYVRIQAANQYRLYRDRSLYGLVSAVVRHPDDGEVRQMLRLLAEAALAGGEVELCEPLELAVQAVRASADGHAAAMLRHQFYDILADLRAVGAGSGEGDLWGVHKRRLGAASEALVSVLGGRGDAQALLARATEPPSQNEFADPYAQMLVSETRRRLAGAPGFPRGYAGMESYARLTLAESLLVCGQGEADIQTELAIAEDIACNIQDAGFCALTTARCATLRRRWWARLLPATAGGAPFDVVALVDAVANDVPAPAAVTIEHEVGCTYRARQHTPGSQPLPPWLLAARSLEEVARVYQAQVRDLSRLNPSVTDAKRPLDPHTLVVVPDPSFRDVVAPFLAAAVLVDGRIEDRRKVRLIQRLVAPAMSRPTAAHTLLARLVLAAARVNPLDVLGLEPVVADYARTVAAPRPDRSRGIVRDPFRI